MHTKPGNEFDHEATICELPGGVYTIDRTCDDDVRRATNAESSESPAPHPIFASIATLTSIGLSIGELLEGCGADFAQGPMLGEFRVRFARPLEFDAAYAVTGRVASIERKRSRRLGAMDLLRLETELTSPGGENIAEVVYTWVLPRRGE